MWHRWCVCKSAAGQTVILMSNSLVARSESPSFMDTFKALLDKITVEHISLMSITSNLDEPAWMAKLWMR